MFEAVFTKIDLQNANTLEEKNSCTTCLHFLQLRASLHWCRIDLCTKKYLLILRILFLTFEMPKTTLWQTFYLCWAMLWFKHEGQSNTKAVQFFFWGQMVSGTQLLPHLICTVPEYTGTVPQYTFSSGLWHTFIRTYPTNWSLVPNKPRVLDRAPSVEISPDYEGF